MKILFIQTGKTSFSSVAEGVDDYKERIKKYAPFEIVTLPDLKNTRNMPPMEQKSREGKLLLDFVSNDDHLILLDERGKEYTTIQFSGKLEKLLMGGKKRILFVTGGAYGFSDDVYNRADEKLALSKLTFPHQLVRLLFMEQLYRAFTVIRGEPYHHE